MRSGVNGTPSLFINGLRHDGPRDAESLVAILRQARTMRGEDTCAHPTANHGRR